MKCEHVYHPLSNRCLSCGLEYKGILEDGLSEELTFTDKLSVTVSSQFGSDEYIARIARHDQEGGVTNLIKHLMKNRHGSPFEFGQITFKCELPLFIIQQMLRHRIGVSYSQWSLRWDKAPLRMYVPSPERPLFPWDGQQKNVRTNKFGSHSEEEYNQVKKQMTEAFKASNDTYQELLKKGVAQELARIVLPAAQMSIIHVSFNPRSLMHFLSLRIDSPDNKFPSHPQYEVQKVAEAFEEDFASFWPITHDAFANNGRVAP